MLIITILFTTYCFGKFRMSKALQGTIYPYIVKLKSSLLMLQIVCKSWVFAFWHSVAYFAWIFVKTVTKVYITISRNALCRFCNLEKLRLYWGSGKYHKFIYSYSPNLNKNEWKKLLHFYPGHFLNLVYCKIVRCLHFSFKRDVFVHPINIPWPLPWEAPNNSFTNTW